METRIATLGIIVEDLNCADPLNAILHEYGQYIIGRMGIPYRDKRVSIICIAMEAPQDEISAMSGKIGRLSGVSAKIAYSKMTFNDENEN